MASILTPEDIRGWNPKKVAVFKETFFEYLQHVRIDSKDKGGGYLVGDNLYRSQKMALDAVFSALEKDIHDIKFLKSRQLGISTTFELLGGFWLGIHPGLKGTIVMDTGTNARKARVRIESTIANMDPKLGFPKKQTSNREGLILTNGSTLQYQAAGVKNTQSSGAFGRSEGINFCHCSEMCSWNNDEGIASFSQALSTEFPNRLYIWESTARGMNSWYDMWEEAKADDLNQRAIFIGWWAKDNQLFKYGSREFDRYGKPEPTDAEKERIAEVESRYGWVVTREQLAWYRWKSDPKFGGQGETDDNAPENELIAQEQPWTEEECFLLSGSSFFPSEILTEVAKETVSGDYQGYRYSFGTEFVHTIMLETRAKKDVTLKVWEQPDEEGVYIVAADPAFGYDESNDRSCVEVFRCYADCLEQVAEFADSQISADKFAWVIGSLCGAYKNVTMTCELNGPGAMVFNEWKNLKTYTSRGYMAEEAAQLGFKNVFANVKNYMYARVDAAGGGSSTYQFKTTSALKVLIFEQCRGYFQNRHLAVRSMETLKEMQSVVRNGDRIQGEGKKKDDRVFTLALGVHTWDQYVRRNLSAAGRTKNAEAERLNSKRSFVDRLALFNKNSLDRMFDAKERERKLAMIAASKERWRRR